MSELSPKENYLRLSKGEMPEYVPQFTMMAPPFKGPMVTKIISPNLFNDTHVSPDGGYDIWGVKYVANEETGFASIPGPNNFILKDIDEWEKIIIPPKMPSINWEKLAEDDIKATGVNRKETAVVLSSLIMPFQQIMAFMGFNEGLCALYESPDKVKDLLNYMLDFLMPIVEKSVEYYKPDVYYIADDTASKYNSFFSPEIYRDIFKPVYERIARPANERGIPIQFHNCGRCEDFLDDMIDFGVKYWDPAQTTNDLLGIKEKYKGKIALCGCWDWNPPESWPLVNEEEVREDIRKTIDTFSQGGGYAFCGAVLGAAGDKTVEKVNGWIKEEVYYYSRKVYK